MCSIKFWIRILCVTVVCGFILACGKANEKAPALGSSGKHPDTWLAGHRAAYQQNRDQCRECHGIDLNGGITKVDCFNQGALGSCHANGHGPRPVIHPVPFKDPALHGAMARTDLTVCQDCHGTSGGAGSNPRFNLTYGSLPTGCEASGCHSPNMAHPKPWGSHGSAGNQKNSCVLCHGADFEGSPAISAPSCKNCHIQLTAGFAPVQGQCTSCHGNPPDGSATPNRAGSHAVHLALSGMSGNCAACHTGGGSGAASHGTLASPTLAFASAFSPAAFNGTTCTSVSCHGGQTTPLWNGGVLDVANCTSCHQPGTANYTSYNSGQHALHLAINGIACIDCHDVTSKAIHFKNVTTKVFETSPSTTIRSNLNYTPQKSCTVTSPSPFTGCHSDKKDWP